MLLAILDSAGALWLHKKNSPAVRALGCGSIQVLSDSKDPLVVKDFVLGNVLKQDVVECRSVKDDSRVATTERYIRRCQPAA